MSTRQPRAILAACIVTEFRIFSIPNLRPSWYYFLNKPAFRVRSREVPLNCPLVVRGCTGRRKTGKHAIFVPQHSNKQINLKSKPQTQTLPSRPTLKTLTLSLEWMGLQSLHHKPQILHTLLPHWRLILRLLALKG